MDLVFTNELIDAFWCRRDTAAAFRAHPDATCALLKRRKDLWTTSRGVVEAEVQAGEK